MESFLHFYRSLGRADRTPEVEAALAETLRRHPEYAVEVQRDAALDSAVSTAMASVPVPAGLREKLLQNAFARRGTALRRTAYQYLAMAALVFVCIGLVGGVRWQFRPTPDADTIAMQHEREREESQIAVQAWLEKNDLPNALPKDFDYRHHSFHGKGEIAGKDIPVVQFQIGREYARVYIVREAELNTEKLKDAQASLCNVMIVRHPDPKIKIVYLIVYTTENLNPFLRNFNVPNA